ncbi:MAG: hypothetical protein IPJ65_26645 [Archangiaceae bacterium]|nr:hypothetical protein [Archangiaceae bacterium]
MPLPSRAPGQALVLFALTLMVLTLMALVTLSFGVRIKERLELQTVADTAAYDSAVLEARAFNTVAVVNRTEWSLLVAQSAAQSYLSWATEYRSAIEGLGDHLPSTPACAGVRSALSTERDRVQQVWARSELEAFRELQRLARVQEELLREESRREYAHLERLVKRQEVTTEVLSAAREGLRGTVSSTGDNGKNTQQLAADCNAAVACDISRPDFERYRRNWTIMRHQHELMHGTRGDPFTTGRLGGDRAMQQALSRALGNAAVTFTGDGSSYRSHRIFTHGGEFAEGPGNAIYPRLMPSSAMSDDHGRLTVAAPGCRASFTPTAWLRTGAEAALNVHTWGDGAVQRHCPDEHAANHALPDLGQGHGWPLIIDYNDQAPEVLASSGLMFGQPTTVVELTRDTANAARDFWELRFDWLGRASYDPAPLQRSRARSRGLAYYHRGGAWAEPPNFVNPFWRATLISARREPSP